MNETNNTSPTNSDQDLVIINDVNALAEAVIAWHARAVATVQHMMNIPEGSETIVDERSIKLEGDAYQAFRLGIHVALHELGSLPFAGVPDDAQDAAEQPQAKEASFDLPGLGEPSATAH